MKGDVSGGNFVVFEPKLSSCILLLSSPSPLLIHVFYKCPCIRDDLHQQAW